MAINIDWARWLRASVFHHLKDTLVADALISESNIHIESGPKKLGAEPYSIELRVDGPEFEGQTANVWRAHLEANGLITVKINDDGNRYLIDTLAGLVSNAMSLRIPVLKLGGLAQDDESHVTCLFQKHGGRERIDVAHFGQVNPTDRIVQATVEAHYHGDLEI